MAPIVGLLKGILSRNMSVPKYEAENTVNSEEMKRSPSIDGIVGFQSFPLATSCTCIAKIHYMKGFCVIASPACLRLLHMDDSEVMAR